MTSLTESLAGQLSISLADQQGLEAKAGAIRPREGRSYVCGDYTVPLRRIRELDFIALGPPS